jgi:hypothetical protein
MHRLDLLLLGVPVRLGTSDPAAARRLAVAYEAAASDLTRPMVTASLDPDPGGGFRVIVEDRPAAPAPGLVEAIRTLNHEVLHAVMRRRQDLLFVHAAVLEDEGRALVLAGESGSGKSTLALALALAGCRYLSDEILAFDPLSGDLLAYPRAPKIRDVCMHHFQGLSGRFVGEGEGRFLPLREFRIGPARVSPRRILFLFPRYTAGAGVALRDLSPGQTLLQLAQSALNFGAHREASVDGLARLLACGEGALLAWSDPHAAARKIRDRARGSEGP